MIDLPNLNNANTRAAQLAVEALRAKGKFVVAEYHGVNFVDHSAHDTEGLAVAHANRVETSIVGARAKILHPFN